MFSQSFWAPFRRPRPDNDQPAPRPVPAPNPRYLPPIPPTNLHDSLVHIFAHLSITELPTLRLVNRSWNEAALSRIATRTALTIEITCSSGSSARNLDCIKYRPLASPEEMFYLDNILEVHERLASQPKKILRSTTILEVIGEVITLNNAHLPALVDFLIRYTSGNLTNLVIYIESCNLCPTNFKNLVGHLVDLIEASPNLSRLSLWPVLHRYNTRIDGHRRIHFLSEGSILLLYPLFEALRVRPNLKQLDLNLLKGLLRFNPNLYLVFPHVQRLSLGDTIPRRVLLSYKIPECTNLRHLKLTWPQGDGLTLTDLALFFEQFAEANGSELISLALKCFPAEALVFLGVYWHQLERLRLMSDSCWSFYSTIESESLLQLNHLTELELINYQLLPNRPIYQALPFVSKLTLTHFVALFLWFIDYTNDTDYLYGRPPPSENTPPIPRVNVPLFVQSLFEQFPAVRHLTLIGPVYQEARVRQELRQELVVLERVHRLSMFFTDRGPVFPPNDEADILALESEAFELMEMVMAEEEETEGADAETISLDDFADEDDESLGGRSLMPELQVPKGKL